MFDSMPDWLYNTLFPINRWVHLVCTALLVGGVLFYEFVIPQALDELKEEHQMSVFGRVRWYFSKVVYLSAFLLLVTGAISAFNKWSLYQKSHSVEAPGFWFVLHAGVGLAALAIALRLTLSPKMPPLSWMRLNFVLLLVVMFLGAVTRHVQMAPGTIPPGSAHDDVDESMLRRATPAPFVAPAPEDDSDAATHPTTRPAE